MKLRKQVITGSLSFFMIVSNLTTIQATDKNEDGMNLEQVSISEIESMPNKPGNYEIIDWLERGKDLHNFIFDYTATNFEEKTEFSVKEGREFSTIYRDNKYGGYMIPAFYGENRPLVSREHDGEDDQESISVTSALIAASLMGIDMDTALPKELNAQISDEVVEDIGDGLDFTYETYLDNALKFFWTYEGTDIFTNVPNGSMSELQNMPGAYQAFDNFWYMLIANQNFYRLADLNPNWRPELVEELQMTVADRMCDMVDVLGKENCDFNIQGFDFIKMAPVKAPGTGRRQPDGAVGTANILYYSYKIFKDIDKEKSDKYLEYTFYCMDYIDSLTNNPYYENMLIDAVYLSTMINAEQKTAYDTTKYLKWITTTSKSSVRNWGGVNYSQDGIDVYGMTGEPNNGYSYFFNSIYPMTSILPAAKYDPSYARMAGKWAINITNASKYFLPDQWSEEHQTDGEYIDEVEGGVMAYESLRKNSNGKNFYATGDAKQNATSGWLAGENTTNFGLYGGVYTGYLGALVEKTNVEGILKLDCNKTDYFQHDMYQSYLYYNPFMESKEVEIDLGSNQYDLYDSVSGKYLKRNVTGKQTFNVLADSARVIVLAPANSTVTYNGGTTTIDGVLVAHSNALVLDDEGTEFIESIEIKGLDTITQKGQTVQYTAELTPNDNLMDPRVVWSVMELNGKETDKAVISKNGEVTVKKNGVIKVAASSIDGSGIKEEKEVTITGQTIASLSEGKETQTSSVNGNNGGHLAVDGDDTTRWIASSSEETPWIYVDLAAQANIDFIVLNWETARPPKYKVQVSDNAQDWTDVSSVDDEGNSNKIVRFDFDGGVSGRYVRIYAEKKSNYGCSLYEFDVYGQYINIDKQVTTITVSSENNINTITTKNRPLQMYASIQPEDATDKRVEWLVYNEDGSRTAKAEITSSGKLTPLDNGKIRVVARAVDGSGVMGEFPVMLENQDKDNLALQKTSYVSHQESSNPKENAFDGKTDSRWASGSTDNNQWITVDLGDVYEVDKVVLYWESFSKHYKIQGSLNNTDFFDLFEENNGQGEVEEKTFEAKPVRYVKMQNIERGTNYGCSLWEFQVYGVKYKKTLVEKITITSETGKNEITVKNKLLQLNAKVEPYDATENEVEWSVYNEDGGKTNLATITQDGLLVPKGNGVVKIVAFAIDGSDVKAELIIKITGQDVENIALGKDVVASSDTGGLLPKYAVDGKANTRWGSKENDNESITVDLGDLYYLNQVALHWEDAYASQYNIEISLDGEKYTTIHQEETGQGSLENIYFENEVARYVKMQGIKRATKYGYSLWEFEVYGKAVKEDLILFYEAVKETDEEKYTPNSFKVFSSAFKQAQNVIEDQQSPTTQVEDSLKELTLAYENLVLRANTDILAETILRAESIEGKLYTPQTFGDLLKQIKSSKDILKDKNISQEEVEQSILQLEKALSNLKLIANKDKLEKKVQEVEKLDLTSYTKETSKQLQTILLKAKEILKDENASQEDVDIMYNKLNEAINNLVLKADKKILEDLVDQIEKLSLDSYTQKSVEKLEEALTSAKSVLYNEFALDQDIQEAYNRLLKAFTQLEKEGEILGNENNSSQNVSSTNETSKEISKTQTGDSTIIVSYIVLGMMALSVLMYIQKKKTIIK